MVLLSNSQTSTTRGLEKAFDESNSNAAWSEELFYVSIALSYR